MRILSRYLLKTAAGPFLFALGVLTGLLMINTVARRIEDLAGKGLPLSVIIEVFLLSIPHVLALTMPMAVLVAVLYTFSQLAADNEVTALKASGVNLARLVVPLLGAATVLAGLMLWFNDQLLPDTNHRLKNLLIDVGQKSPTLQLEERVINPIPSNDYRTRYYLQAAAVDPASNTLSDVVIWDMSDPRQIRTVYADSGQMAFNQARTDLFLTLYSGHINQLEEGLPERFQRIFFNEQVIRMRNVGNVLQRSEGEGHRGEREMGLAMLQEAADERAAELARIEDEIDRFTSAALERTLSGASGPLYARDVVQEEAGEADGDQPATRADADAGAETADGPPARDGPQAGAGGNDTSALPAGDVPESRRVPLTPEREPGAPAAPAAESGEAIPEAGALLRERMARAGAETSARTEARTTDTAARLNPERITQAKDSAIAARTGLEPPAQAPGEAAADALPRPDAARQKLAVDRIRTAQARRTDERGPDLLATSAAAELNSLADRARSRRLQVNSYQVEYQKKLAIPFACIVFVLIGAPLAVRFPRGGVGMVIAISLGIFAIYYVGLIGGEKLADEGYVDPFWAMWATNAIFLLLGIWGMFRIGYESSTSRGGGWDDLIHSLKTVLKRPFTSQPAESTAGAEAGT